ncbi:MAG TPA: isoleucine--tRNA ligase [Chitinophagales bacterium]|nr:isoleucine--tRNA ligase [Chitinophagales bacterium]
MTYPEYKSLNLPEIDQEILKFWEEEKIFDQSVSSREGKTPFIFYEGPPSANGIPGIHHVLSRTLKDLFCRYKTLQGFQVKRKGGWDTHGLPVELSVEKMLGIKKDDIGKKISIEEYNGICRKEVMKYKDVWENLTKKMGYWTDLEHPYITFENNYIETLWWLLKKFYEKGYLYEGYTIQPYSPAAGTGLSTHELNQPETYKPIRDTSIVAQFKISHESLVNSHLKEFVNDKSPMTNDFYFLAWTTTSWTLPSNCALAVGENIIYSLVKTFNPYTSLPITVILAKDLVGKYFPEKNAELKLEDYKPGDKELPFKIIGEVVGKDLEWIRYEQLMPYVQPDGKAFVVIVGDFVTTEEGTGIVHTASLFGADDFRVCKAKGIASILVKDENNKSVPLVNLQGRFVKEVIDFAGEYVKEQYYTEEEKEIERQKQGGQKYLSVDERISIKLKKENKAFKVEKFEHPYPHCWRTDKPILYYPLDSWFIKVTACKERLVELNKTINWKPESTGIGRFGNWLENVQDWNLSRSRYWGTPLPIWKTEDGTEEICIGSIEELITEYQKATSAGLNKNSRLTSSPDLLGIHDSPKESGQTRLDVELHKPYVDEIQLISAKGKVMRRIPDLVDVWFDSGAMPYAQWHYPFENQETFKSNFPADYIAEGVDQTRGWFYTLHVIAGMLFDSVAYKNVVSNGLVLDKFGNKMSKRIGNVVEPFEVMAQYGADATRWYLVSNSQPWDNLKFDIGGVDEVRRKLFGTLYNTYAFFALYANIDGFEIDEMKVVPVQERSEMDRWILSKLHSLVKSVTESYDDYNPTPAARLIEEFVDRHLSNWYVRLSRRKFWKGEMSGDKRAAYETLFECLNVVGQLMSPIAPFFSEWLYINLTGGVRDKAVQNKTPLAAPSVHLTLLTKAEENIIDKDLEERMELAQNISSLVFSIRKKVNIKVRQPLQKILLPTSDEHIKDQVTKVKDLILSEVNVKELEFLSDASGFIKKRVKPNFKLLGQKLGKRMKQANELLSSLPQQEILKLEQKGSIELEIDGEKIPIEIKEVELISEDIPGWEVANESELTVALDVSITEILRQEGYSRELVNRIQKLRKDLNFNVTDHIDVLMEKSDEINLSVLKFKNYICAEILADSLELVDSLDHGVSIDVNELLVKIIIKQKTSRDGKK